MSMLGLALFVVLGIPVQDTGVVTIDLGKKGSIPALTVCPSCTYTSLRKAIEDALPGATIYVLGGVYRESTLVIRKPLTLIGEDDPVLDGEGKFEILIVDSVDGFHIKGFTFRGSGISFTQDQAAIRLRRSSNCIVENNTFLDNFFAIYLEASHTCVVRNNKIRGPGRSEAFSGNGIHLWNAYNVWVQGNYVSHHRDGIYLEFVRDSHIYDNVSEQQIRYGMHFMYSDRNDFARNVFRRCGAGVAVMYSKRIRLRNNRFEDNWGGASYGLLMKDIDDSEIEGNLFYRNTVGMLADGANRLFVRGNTFEKNGWAIRVLGNSMGMSFRYNNVIDNTFEVASNASESFNAFLMNFWGSYVGYDLNRDGYGDVPHRPVRLFTQLVEQYPASVILLHSPLEYLIAYAERLLPVLSPSVVEDDRPLMGEVVWSASKDSSNGTDR